MKRILNFCFPTPTSMACFLIMMSGYSPTQSLSASPPQEQKKQSTTQSREPDFKSIFDGKTLSGWEATPPGSDDAWQVSDGVITGTGGKVRGYLNYAGNKNIADLELKFSYRFPGKGNSGVSIRAIPDPTKKRNFQSYHADLGHLGIGKQVLGAWDFHTPGRTEHRCFRGDRLVIDANDRPHTTPIEDGLQTSDIHRGQWNKVHIIARGNQFKLYINDRLASEFTEHLPHDKRLKRGMLQLQLHDPNMVVEFKNIRLKILD
jgi:hypothetical protein